LDRNHRHRRLGRDAHLGRGHRLLLSGGKRPGAPCTCGRRHARVQSLGFNQTGHVFFNLFGGEPETLLGQFSGGFESSASLAGVMLGPEAFGQPAVGPFTAESLPLVLHRQ